MIDFQSGEIAGWEHWIANIVSKSLNLKSESYISDQSLEIWPSAPTIQAL